MPPDDTFAQFVRFAEAHGLKPEQAPELFGPTAVNAQSSNGGLAVGLDDAGTLTVFRWPRPSFYDQLKYHTRDRDEPRFGVAPNEGAFLGLRLGEDDDAETAWLRDWETTQRYADEFADAVTTEHRSDEHGLTATVADVVARERDVLARSVTVERDDHADAIDADPDDTDADYDDPDDTDADYDDPDDTDADDATGDAPTVDLLAFENLNLVVSKEPENPIQDWGREDENTDTATYERWLDAVVHAKRGVDESTGRERSVAVGMGFDRESDGHHVGGDDHEPAAAAPAERESDERDAYEAATDGTLPGNDAYTGQTTGVLRAGLDLTGGSDRVTVLFAAGDDEDEVASLLDAARDRAHDDRRRAKREWLAGVLDDPPMPDTDDEAILAVCRRALVTLVTNYDPASGALVASIATQSPYNLDWIRDGAFFNHALDLLGLTDWVERRNRWYASLQQRVDDYRVDQLATPPGNWAMNFYADGVPGGPIPWEIDETAYGIWTLYDHYRVTGEESYLRDVYPAIRRAADFLVAYRDAETGLHYPAHEDDNVIPSQTVVGAGPVRLGLDAAAAAAAELGEDEAAARYAGRHDELDAAIADHLWNPDDGAYNRGWPDVERAWGIPLVPDPEADPTLGWPIALDPPDDPRMERHLERVWETIAPTFEEPDRGERAFGQYEAKGLVSLARAWRSDPERMERVRDGVRWLAREHATSDTRIMGELWLREDGDIRTSVSQPHVWEQLLVYYASLEAFPPDGIDLPGEGAADEQLDGAADGPANGSTDGWHGVLERLRARNGR